jgi:hypothetical protein
MARQNRRYCIESCRLKRSEQRTCVPRSVPTLIRKLSPLRLDDLRLRWFDVPTSRCFDARIGRPRLRRAAHDRRVASHSFLTLTTLHFLRVSFSCLPCVSALNVVLGLVSSPGTMRILFVAALLSCFLMRNDAFLVPGYVMMIKHSHHDVKGVSYCNIITRSQSGNTVNHLGRSLPLVHGLRRKERSSNLPCICSSMDTKQTDSGTVAANALNTEPNRAAYQGLERTLGSARQLGWKEGNVMSALDLAKENSEAMLWKSVKPMYRRASQSEVRMLTRGVIKVRVLVLMACF